MKTSIVFIGCFVDVSEHAAARTGTGDGDSSPFETAFAAGGDLRMSLCSSGRCGFVAPMTTRFGSATAAVTTVEDVKVQFKSNGNAWRARNHPLSEKQFQDHNRYPEGHGFARANVRRAARGASG